MTAVTISKRKSLFASLSGAHLVGAGILLSRVAGLVRERVFAHYFGNSDAGDAFKAALKIPNFLQNLFGEGVLSASFIPVYAGLLARHDDEEAGKLAGAIASILALVVSFVVLLGVLATPWLIGLIAPGFEGEKRELTIRLVQIFFPGTGLLVISAWCLGILNSHRRFFLSYAAPVLWNVSIIATLLMFGGKYGKTHLAVTAAWGLVLGSLLQLGSQLPLALKLVPSFRANLSLRLRSVRTVLANFAPVVVSRGVVQVSAYIDNVLGSFLPTGAVSALAYAQTIYLLPISLFGMSISAAELPQMSSATGTDAEIAAFLRGRINLSLRKIALLVIPSTVAFATLGDVIVSAIFQTGAFTRNDTLYVWGVLAGSTIGLLSATLGRIYSSAFYALKDTRTPLRFAILRVLLTTVLGLFFALELPKILGLRASWGTAGLTASAGISGWIEFLLLRRAMNRKAGYTGITVEMQLKLWGSALFAAAIGFGVRVALPGLQPVALALAVFLPYGLAYFGLASLWDVPEAQDLVKRVQRLLSRK